MFQYPSAFPVDEANAVLALMSGSAKPSNDTYRAGWVLAGYALSQIAPTTTIKGSADHCFKGVVGGEVSKEDVKMTFDSLKAAVHLDPNMKQGLSIPWHDLFVVLVQALTQGLEILVNVGT